MYELLTIHYTDSFWSKVKCGDTTDDCWEWQSRKTKDGYGNMRTQKAGKTYSYAHRVSWMLEHWEDIPDGMVIRHTCDNPGCVNPNHLKLGTQLDNIKDTVSRNRHWNGK